MNILYHDLGRDPLYKIWNKINGNMIIFTYTDGGSIVFHDKILPIKKGTLCFIDGNTYHYTIPDIPDVYDRSKIFIPSATVNQLVDLTPKNSSFYKLFSDKSVVYAIIPNNLITQVDIVYKDAKNAFDKNDSAGFICSFFKLMTYLEKYSTEQIFTAKDFISKTIEYINNNYQQDITLDDICNLCHVSKHYLCRKFKKTVGMTIMDYILATRITAAKTLLSTKKINISEISENCGFSSFSYFCQAFRKSTGITALEYRNKHDGN